MPPESHALALELLGELTEPLLVVNRDREVIFRSRAFVSLSGSERRESPCAALLLPPLTPASRSCCCWEALDAYRARGGSGIWHIARADGSRVPVLCSLLPVGIGAAPGLLAIRMRAVAADISPIALAFFGGMRAAAAGDCGYFAAATSYLKSACGIGAAAWFRPASGAAAARIEHACGFDQDSLNGLAHRLGEAPPAELHDVVIGGSDRPRIVHVFRPLAGAGSGLALGRLESPLDERLIDAARAAVLAATHPTAATPPPFADPELLQMLSAAERETLQLLAEGLSDKAIAQRRGLSLYTVKHQVARILKKTGVQRRTGLIRRFEPRPPSAPLLAARA
jgi:DNA-binding CsgD family transcriptional regulator